MAFSISRRVIWDVWSTNRKDQRFEAVYTFVVNQLNGDILEEDAMKRLKVKLRKMSQQFSQKFVKCGRVRDRFLNCNQEWLDATVTFLTAAKSKTGPRNTPGRPEKTFELCCERTKKRKVKDIVLQNSAEQLSLASAMKLQAEGKNDSAAIVKELFVSSPARGTAFKKARKSFSRTPQKISANEALATMVDANLSTHQYNSIRQRAKNFPPYHLVKQAKQACYPHGGIRVTETSAEVDLQSLIDHTIQRLCVSQVEVISMPQFDEGAMHIDIKWGCDGSSQSPYKQKFSEENASDTNLFSISMVPIQIHNENNGRKNIMWQNPAPSSTRYCRPIKFKFMKESTETIQTEIQYIQEQIKALRPTKVTINEKDYTFNANLILCMIDGKVCSAVASCTSSQKCYICGATSRDMNKLSSLESKPIRKEYLSFGLSPLHCWIRFLECCLHIAYRLDIKQWQARGKNKAIVAKRKSRIQDEFRRELGLLVDIPKQQAGNTNDGNSARRFFRNTEKTSEITGLNLELLQRFRTTLEVLGSGYAINADKFEEYAKETRELYLREYAWYAMPVTVHKVLYHGKAIIESCVLPIGQLSEEAQEARNKDNRTYRELFTRKMSRVHTNTDLFNRLFISSDPLISSLRMKPKTKKGVICREAIQLLLEVDPFSNLREDEKTSSSEDSD